MRDTKERLLRDTKERLIHEGYKGEACTVCAAGKFKYAGEGACETCPSLTTSTMGAGNRSACLFPQVLAYF